MAKKNTKKTSFKPSNFYWIFLVFFVGVAVTAYGIYYFYHKPQAVRYKEFGIYFPQGDYLHGIDVSRYQKNIDWQEVDSMEIGGIRIDFAFIKATEGTSLKDKKFDANWENSKKTSIKRGAYHFFRCNRDPELQAQFFLKTVNFQAGDLPPVLDIETRDGKSSEVIRERAKRFLNLVEEKIGVKPIIYTNADFYKEHLSDGTFEEYPFWVAHYKEPHQPRTERAWQFWQHSDQGRVNSIKGAVDFNVFNGDEDDLEQLTLPK